VNYIRKYLACPHDLGALIVIINKYMLYGCSGVGMGLMA
jgi:hypothetical protein